mgnify:CR=1 FL=1|tara:strand:- start:1981 stop:3834 length:1854 start_codon:yes stop_codon:yes gene_type:complete
MAGNHSSSLSPRQRMINMMYLVLTALLALNVSKSVLDAFFRVDKTLTQTVSDKALHNEERYFEFQIRAENNPQKIKKWNDMAQELKGKTEEVSNLIDSIRYELWKVGGPTIDGDAVEITDYMEEKKSLILAIQGQDAYELIDKANKNSPKIIMLDEHDGKPAAALRLKNALTSYREYLLSLDIFPLEDTTIRPEIQKMLSTDDVAMDATTQSWEEHEYGGYPLVGVLTFLNQTNLNVRSAEDMMLELLEQKTGKSLVSIDKQIPYAIPQSSFIMAGDSLKARLFLAGIDTKQKPVYDIYEIDEKLKNPETGEPLPKGTTFEPIYDIANRRDADGNIIGTDTLGFKYEYTPDTLNIIEREIMTNVDGMGVYSRKMAQKGTKYIGGFATVRSPEGDLVYPWVMEIRVESPNPVIAPTNLNVIYAGLFNDFSIAAPGYDPKDLQLISNVGRKLKITKQASGKYKLVISDDDRKSLKGNPIKLSVKDAKTGKVIGAPLNFKVYETPKSLTTVNGKANFAGDCSMSITQVKLAKNLKAQKNPSFVYDLKYIVSSFTFEYTKDGIPQQVNVKGPKFNKEIKQVFKNARSGDRFKISNIETLMYQNEKNTGETGVGEPIYITVK